MSDDNTQDAAEPSPASAGSAADSAALTADETRAVRCGANALRVAANRAASYDDQRGMELMADHIEAMLDRMG